MDILSPSYFLHFASAMCLLSCLQLYIKLLSLPSQVLCGHSFLWHSSVGQDRATTALSHVQIPSHGTFDPLIVFQCSLSLQLIFWVILAILLNWRKARNWFSGCQSAPPVQMWLPLSINMDLERVLIIAELSSQRICYSLHSTFPEFHTCMVSQTNGWPDLFYSPSSWGAFPTWSFT